jgi:hypothetical protein
LKQLNITFLYYWKGTRLFNDTLCSTSAFSLEKLTVEVSFGLVSEEYNRDVLNFIGQQGSSLRYLHIFKTLLTVERQALLLSSKVEELRLDSCVFVSDFNRASVQNVSIRKLLIFYSTQDGIALSDFLKNCPRLNELVLYNVRLTAPLILVLNHHLPNLEKLTIESFVRPVYIPSLKVLHFRNINLIQQQDAIALIGLNNQLKELQVPRDWARDPTFDFVLENLNLEKLIFT